MPIYPYKNTETGETRDVFLSVDERDSYKGEDGTEDCWKRQLTKPFMNVDSSSSIDPFNKEEFKKVTNNKKGTVGDLLELSEELSEKRAEKNGGEDPVKRKHFDEYKKKTGKRHQEDVPKNIEVNGIKIDLTED